MPIPRHCQAARRLERGPPPPAHPPDGWSGCTISSQAPFLMGPADLETLVTSSSAEPRCRQRDHPDCGRVLNGQSWQTDDARHRTSCFRLSIRFFRHQYAACSPADDQQVLCSFRPRLSDSDPLWLGCIGRAKESLARSTGGVGQPPGNKHLPHVVSRRVCDETRRVPCHC